MTDRPLAKYAHDFIFTGEHEEFGDDEVIVHNLGTDRVIVSIWDDQGCHVLPYRMNTHDDNTVKIYIGEKMERARVGLAEIPNGTELEVTVIG